MRPDGLIFLFRVVPDIGAVTLLVGHLGSLARDGDSNTPVQTAVGDKTFILEVDDDDFGCNISTFHILILWMG